MNNFILVTIWNDGVFWSSLLRIMYSLLIFFLFWTGWKLSAWCLCVFSELSWALMVLVWRIILDFWALLFFLINVAKISLIWFWRFYWLIFHEFWFFVNVCCSSNDTGWKAGSIDWCFLILRCYILHITDRCVMNDVHILLRLNKINKKYNLSP